MFDWVAFSRKFPFGDLSIPQGEYEARVLQSLSELQGGQKAMLLDLLGLQWICFLEQLRTLHAMRVTPDLPGPIANAAARMRLSDKLRCRFGLTPRNLREDLFNIGQVNLLTKLSGA